MVLVKHGLGKNMVSSSTLITNSLLTQQSQQNHSNVKLFRGIVYQLTSMITRLLFKDDQNDITRESKKEGFRL